MKTRKKFFVLILLAFSTIAQGQSSLKFPNSVNNPVNWNSETNIYTENSLNAVGPQLSGGASSERILTSLYSFNISAGYVVTGIEVKIKARSSIYSCEDEGGDEGGSTGKSWDKEVMLIKNGVVQAVSNKAYPSTNLWSSNADTVRTYGGPSDLWGNSWTSSDVNSSNFGVAFSYAGKNKAYLNSDYISIKIYYSYVLPIRLASFEISKENTGNYKLSWRTEEESNVNYYNVQESLDGKEFKTVGLVFANNRPSSYSSPKKINSSKSYFRLEIVDLDGFVSYSKTVYISDKLESKLKVYSTQSELLIETSSPNIDDFKIFSMSGNLILFKRKLAGRSIIDISNLPSGIYVIKSSSGETAKFLK